MVSWFRRLLRIKSSLQVEKEVLREPLMKRATRQNRDFLTQLEALEGKKREPNH